MLSVVLVILALLVLRMRTAVDRLRSGLDTLRDETSRQERLLREEMARNREEIREAAAEGRREGSATINQLADALMRRITEVAGLQKNQLDAYLAQIDGRMAGNEARLDRLREMVEERLRLLQEDNARKLDQMRATVDEKLHDTLERRLGESFKLVSDRLESVQKGLGEMQSLASGVGDLKRVLTNVKIRGTLGEIQLDSLLDQILSPGQYERNVETRPGSGHRVEFALKLPGRSADGDGCVWLPLDSKFPQEDYLRYCDALEAGDAAAAADAVRHLERTVREMGRMIADKYLDPPNTTDFGVMFLPTEGLYAEVLRRPGLFEALQRDCKVVVAGPTTLAALLSSLQMGFRTLAIEKRSSEVWSLLGAVRTEFAKFGVVLDKTRKKLQEAGNQIDQAAVRSRAISRKLADVQELPVEASSQVLELAMLDELSALPGEED